MIALMPSHLSVILVQIVVPGPLGKVNTHEFLRFILQIAIFLANFAGGVVIFVAIVRGFLLYLVDLIRNRGGEVPKEGIRLSLGRSLSLALEFQLGADILGTALDPSLTDLEVLAAIVILRTVLNYFLGKELDEAQRREREAQATAPRVQAGDTGDHQTVARAARLTRS